MKRKFDISMFNGIPGRAREISISVNSYLYQGIYYYSE